MDIELLWSDPDFNVIYSLVGKSLDDSKKLEMIITRVQLEDFILDQLFQNNDLVNYFLVCLRDKNIDTYSVSFVKLFNNLGRLVYDNDIESGPFPVYDLLETLKIGYAYGIFYRKEN